LEKFALGVSKTEMMVVPSKKNAKTSIPYSVGVSHGIEESLIVSVARKHRLSCRTLVHDVTHTGWNDWNDWNVLNLRNSDEMNMIQACLIPSLSNILTSRSPVSRPFLLSPRQH